MLRWVADHPLAILPLLNETLMIEAKRKYLTYGLMADREENELRVGIFSFPLSEPIRELRTKHINKLVGIHGVVTRRTKVCNQVKRLFLRCAKCGYPSGPFDVADEKDCSALTHSQSPCLKKPEALGSLHLFLGLSNPYIQKPDIQIVPLGFSSVFGACCCQLQN